MRKRPSWGTRFSAMSSSEMTLSRVSRKEWNELSSGSMIWCRMPSMRYLMIRASFWISIWMSEAFLLTAVRMMLLSSLMTESSSSVMLSMVTTSSSTASAGLFQGEGLGLVAQHLGVGVAFFQEFFQLVAVGQERHDLFLGEILDHADLVEVFRVGHGHGRWCRPFPPGGRRGS